MKFKLSLKSFLISLALVLISAPAVSAKSFRSDYRQSTSRSVRITRNIRANQFSFSKPKKLRGHLNLRKGQLVYVSKYEPKLKGYFVRLRSSNRGSFDLVPVRRASWYAQQTLKRNVYRKVKQARERTSHIRKSAEILKPV